jgi:hypothetical protein
MSRRMVTEILVRTFNDGSLTIGCRDMEAGTHQVATAPPELMARDEAMGPFDNYVEAAGTLFRVASGSGE